MCGRFAGFRSLDELKRFFPIDNATCEVTANYNIAPSQKVLTIVRRSGENWLENLHWGLVPFWARDISIGNKLINARCESIAQKPSFRDAFRKRRCLIPADGFFEWQGEKGCKQPMFITLPDKSPFAFAGLWETWCRREDADKIYKSCTIITTRASRSIRTIHHRMPAILKKDAYDSWLDPGNQDAAELAATLKDDIHTTFIGHPVSNQVNSAANNDSSVIDPPV